MIALDVESAHAPLVRCGVDLPPGGSWQATSPITGGPLFAWEPVAEVGGAVARSVEIFARWSAAPAQLRGRVLLRFAELLAARRDDIAELITAEVGKVPAEGLGEVEELIEMCHLAVGLSHQLYGRTLPSARPGFRLMETFHPMGPVGIVTPFSFPAASWGWSAPLALVTGNSVLWKPSPQATMTALACAALLTRAAAELDLPGPCLVLPGGPEVARSIAEDPRVPVVNISGRSRTGQALGPAVVARFGRLLMHLGGNNASVLTPSADLDEAVPSILLAATSAAGQRCSSMRRLIVHESIADDVAARLAAELGRLRVGDPREPGTQVGPLIDAGAYAAMRSALDQAVLDGGRILTGGGRLLAAEIPEAYYVRPALVQMPAQTEIVATETVAPVLYLLRYSSLEEAIALNNAVPYGFSSSIFSTDQTETEAFLRGSDCGIVNVNLHTSGAEVGTAFGGEKATGGGRQCGTDAWQAYMRRVTSAVR